MKTMRTNLCLKPEEAMKRIKISSITITSSNHHSSNIQSFSRILRTNTIKTFKGLKNTSQACNFCSNHFMRTCRNRKLNTWNRLKLSRPSKKNYGTTPIGSILKSEKSKTSLLGRFKRLEKQANPNLNEIPVNHIPDLIQTNADKGRPMFYGALKSHVGTSAFSQSAQQEPIPLRTAPPLPGYQPPRGKMDKRSLRSKKRSFGAILARDPRLGMELGA
ncbi:hypothetical protein PIB30_050290 [Stylosanthes scabra]|uniref:Uncharacterized protein n=1 Tax=Stylosanthes scabra TaxID=79078 RepID=A0ABU6XIS8_9FABA|nr:hypothetical protein [Stylosanthes scabra]